jgi:hypothetical protein
MAIDFSGTTESLQKPPLPLSFSPIPLANFSASGVTKLSSPAFLAFGATGTASGNFVVFPTAKFDNRRSYSTSTGRFTAPVAGTYYFYFQHITNTTGGEYRVVLYKNGAWYGGSNYITQSVGGQVWGVFASQHISLAANDYVNVLYISGPGSLYPSDIVWGQFSGYLIG